MFPFDDVIMWIVYITVCQIPYFAGKYICVEFFFSCPIFADLEVVKHALPGKFEVLYICMFF